MLLYIGIHTQYKLLSKYVPGIICTSSCVVLSTTQVVELGNNSNSTYLRTADSMYLLLIVCTQC